MVPLRLWTCFWGEKHLDLFEKALVKSLCWPINRDALQGAKWDIWTKKKEFGMVVDVAKAVGLDIELHEADQFLADLQPKYLSDNGVMMNKMFQISLKRCLDTKSKMFIAPPDTIFSGDSIPNILQAGEQHGTVVFVIHTRVLPEILNEIDKSMGSAKLVSLAFKHAHKSFVEGECGYDRINTHMGGIMWKRRENGVIAVNHMLPTPYLINVTDLDYKFFSRENPPGQWPPVFGELDHTYPAYCVFNMQRARVLGSSDDAFCVEVTDAAANVPPLEFYDKAEPDKFWRQAFHNQILRQFVVTLRGE